MDPGISARPECRHGWVASTVRAATVSIRVHSSLPTPQPRNGGSGKAEEGRHGRLKRFDGTTRGVAGAQEQAGPVWYDMS